MAGPKRGDFGRRGGGGGGGDDEGGEQEEEEACSTGSGSIRSTRQAGLQEMKGEECRSCHRAKRS